MSETIIRVPIDLLPPPSKPIQTTVLGVTVGNAIQQPAICAVRYVSECIQSADPLSDLGAVFETRYHLLGMERLDVGTSVPRIAARVNQLATRLWKRDSHGDYHVLCDASEVGRPVIDAIRFVLIPQAQVTGVTVTATDKPDSSILYRRESTVGLSYLVSRLQAILQSGRLSIPHDPAMTDLLAQLRDYDTATDRGPDLVRALALACSSEYRPISYDVSPDELPEAAY